MNGTVIVSWARSGRTRCELRAELLDAAEQVVPAPGVQAGGVLAQLVQDLVHLERGQDRLDQDRRPDRPDGQPERLLGMPEDVVPEARLEVRFELGQVEVRAAAPARASSRALWKTNRPKSNSEAEIGPPSTSTWRSSRCQPRGRTTSVAISSLSRYALPSGLSNVERPPDGLGRSRPGRRSTLAQVGESESSRSAMNTRAPEFRALIIIFGSAGPVISTRRSARSAGAAGDGPGVRCGRSAVLGEEVGHDAPVERRSGASCERPAARAVERRTCVGDRRRTPAPRASGRIEAGDGLAADLDPGRGVDPGRRRRRPRLRPPRLPQSSGSRSGSDSDPGTGPGSTIGPG